jgi:hypothetical protein
MASLVTAFGTPFIPAAGDFIVSVTGGLAQLQRRNSAATPWANVDILGPDNAYTVENPVAGAEYKFIAPPGLSTSGVAVRADQ